MILQLFFLKYFIYKIECIYMEVLLLHSDSAAIPFSWKSTENS